VSTATEKKWGIERGGTKRKALNPAGIRGEQRIAVITV